MQILRLRFGFALQRNLRLSEQVGRQKTPEKGQIGAVNPVETEPAELKTDGRFPATQSGSDRVVEQDENGRYHHHDAGSLNQWARHAPNYTS